MTKIILPIILLLLGAILGLLSSLLTSAREKRQNIVMKLLDQYLDVRKHVVEVVSDLTNLRDREEFDLSKRVAYRDSVSRLFYMHYDFLPKPVLDALILLHVSLDYPEDGPYTVVDHAILPMSKQQVIPFVESCSVFRNSALNAALALSSHDPIIRQNAVIKLHARSVLYTLNQFSTIEELLQMEKRIRKAVQP